MPQRSLDAIVAAWTQRRDDLRRLRAMVDGAVLIDELLFELRTWQIEEAGGAVTLQEAHELGGYSVDHLQRMVRKGVLVNVGQKGRPRIRRADVPHRPGHTLPAEPDTAQFGPRRRMALAVLTSHVGGG